ncbi:MAG: polyprenyl synthetase family protein [Lachnospiraceae bacterium]|nr:polyprenyl synthetase family protein [Lachnospiraceae bacterium]
MEIKERINEKVREIEAVIAEYLPDEAGYQRTVTEAMNYSIQAGGKRLRPMLMQETYRMLGGSERIVEPFMAAIEMIHTYSLVHDDLPAMDNDEYRRGRKTTHAVYGEAMAILAGDGLLNYAFETAIRAFELCTAGEDGGASGYRTAAAALKVLAEKAGIFGMIGGQTADILAESRGELAEEELLFIHEHKTAALIQASMMVGAILAGAPSETVQRIEKCAYDVGIAFQIQDDILDVTGDETVLGKPVGSDAKNSKQTYVTMHGLERSAEDVQRLSEEALRILDELGGDNEFLKGLVTQLIHREK